MGEYMADQFEDADDELLDEVDAADDAGLVEIDNELMEDISEALDQEQGSDEPEQEDDPGDEPEQTDEPEAEPEPQAQAPKPQPTQDNRDWNRLAAKTRILERDKRILEDRVNELAEALRTGRIPKPAEAESEEEQLPSLQENAEEHIEKRFERLEREARELKERQAREVEAKQFEARHQRYFDAALQFANQDPEQYNAAVAYVSEGLMQEAMARNPSKTQKEIGDALTKRVKELFVQWGDEGYNPGEMVYDLALKRGFQWQRPEARQAPETRPAGAGQRSGKYGSGVAQPPGGKPETKDDVRRTRERDRKVGSISRVPGAPARGRNQERRLAADEDAYEKETRGVPLSELLKGREVRGR